MCVATSILTFCSYANQAPTNDSTLADSTQVELPYFNKLVHGGFTLGARVGGTSYLYFSPFVGVRLGRFYPGVGVSFSQLIQNKPYLKEERVGLRALVRFRTYKHFFTSLEYDGQKNSVASELGFQKKWTNNILLGVGIAIPITYDSRLTFEFLYQLNYKSGHSPYGHKQMLGRIGFAF